nr:hypothetical protein BCU10_00455 [Vibrio splendidus]
MTHIKTGALLYRLSDFAKRSRNHNQLFMNGTFHFVKDDIHAAGQNVILGLFLCHPLKEVKHDQY